MTSRNRFVSLAASCFGVGARIFAIDRTHGVHVLIDQVERNARSYRACAR